MSHLFSTGLSTTSTEPETSPVILSEDQRRSLESAILGYLIEHYPKIGLQFSIASGAEDPAKYRGVLEEKWVCTTMLTKRILDLEAELESIPAAKRSRLSTAKSQPMLPLGPCIGKVYLSGRPVVTCSLLATAAKDGTVKMWDCAASKYSWRCLRTLVIDTEGQPIMCRFTSESSVVTLSCGMGLQIWDSLNGQRLGAISVDVGAHTTGALEANYGWLCVAFSGQLAALPLNGDQRSLPSAVEPGQLVQLDSDITQVQLMQRSSSNSHEPPLGLTSSRDSTVQLWDLGSLSALATYDGHAGPCRGITALGGRYFYSIAEDGNCLGHIWHVDFTEYRGKPSGRITFRAELTQNVPACAALFFMPAAEVNSLLEQRRKNFASSLSVSYANVKPLTMLKAKGQYMYDDKGIKYLDCRNNVPHVGHCDERVAVAVSDMMSSISTNTRYLHPVRQELASELLSTFPSQLNKLFLVNSGSEANDLALRLARAYTKKNRVVAVERGYHGTTALTISVSPYKLRKFKPDASTSVPDWLSIIPCPSDAAAATRSLEVLRTEAGRDTEGICAFICESGMSVAGVVLPPEGFMSAACEIVRGHGGVYIADEVQVGLGRMGTHFWGFEQQGVLPDIVTVGKPLGNGFPVAAVITTTAISEAFDNEGVEYFSTFGGNTVSCAAALSVLRVIKEDNLQGHALRVGKVLIDELHKAAVESAHIGDIRGSGLFIGVEIVDLCPETALDGPGDGVLVIKPPMCFTEDNARELVRALTQVLNKIDANSNDDTYQSIPT
ncbi:hypothetical protein FOL47_003243 [Perkinsus chesapeaki]|uniref:Uncharacterized protein n=1 Tax=Perkinsus chesapeaki TaxID=330153 RepID=A0A7J6N5H7_PERCH|nr:hypothetical protein FOL47_003243 [Perkinsus chesapeaki]